MGSQQCFKSIELAARNFSQHCGHLGLCVFKIHTAPVKPGQLAGVQIVSNFSFLSSALNYFFIKQIAVSLVCFMYPVPSVYAIL